MGVPMLDFVNCQAAQPNTNNKYLRVRSTNADKYGFALTRSPYAFKAGDQLFENYGQPNHLYFLHHGFSMENNPHDCLQWRTGSDLICLDQKHVTDDMLAARAST